MILYMFAYFSVNWFTALSRYIGSFAHKNKSMDVHDWLRHRVVFFGLDAKAEEQSADNIEEIDCV